MDTVHDISRKVGRLEFDGKVPEGSAEKIKQMLIDM